MDIREIGGNNYELEEGESITDGENSIKGPVQIRVMTHGKTPNGDTLYTIQGSNGNVYPTGASVEALVTRNQDDK